MSELKVADADLRQLFVEHLGILTPAVFDDVSATAKRLRIPLTHAIAERARLPPSFLLEQLAESWKVGFTELRVTDVKPEALRLIREETAKTRLVAAFDRSDSIVKVAAANPRDAQVVADVKRVLQGQNVQFFLAPERAIRRAHLLYAGWLADATQQIGRGMAAPPTKAGEREPPATDLVNRILEYAVVSGASDIHIEPYEWEGLVRYRIDGVLNEVFSLTPESFGPFVARLKVLSGLRVDEKRVPQDGRFAATVGGTEVELRVSSVPTHWGEKIVMRVVTKEALGIDLEGLGLASDDYQILLERILKPFGMILVTGPTGSGKTTSLYATLTRLSTERQGRLNMSTIEDPVERTIPRVSQIAVNVAAGLEFAGGLRALLRQDPDVIMVGEIRDRETAEIGVKAALVGRLLLSTLHTNDAAGAIPRLIDMGIEPFLLASTLELVIAQRLARKICMDCRETASMDSPEFKSLQTRPEFKTALEVLQRRGTLSATGDPLRHVRLFRGRGCARCSGTGYRGRIGLFELLPIGDEVRQLILTRSSSSAIRQAAIAKGMKTMFEDGLAKVFLGETTVDEALRSTA